MGNFSKDPQIKLQNSLLRHYVSVRLQQGVPILDADWNELEDLRRWELWSLLKWFVGDGVPENNDGFKIAPAAGAGLNTIILTSKKAQADWSSVTVNRTLSTAADALGFGPQNYASGKIIGSARARLTSDAAGTFPLNLGSGDKKLVVKADDFIEEEILFRSTDPLITNAGNVPVSDVMAVINAQAHNLIAGLGQGRDFVITGGGDGTSENAGRCLVGGWEALNESNLKYTSQALYDNDALALKWGVAKIAPLSTPAARRIDTVYLDVWEREVDEGEDKEHLVDPRINIETSVRIKREWAVRVEENSISLPPPPVPAGHVFFRLATIARRPGDNTVYSGDITDVRERRLLLPPATLISDVLGGNPADYRRGLGRPTVSLRTAINAVLRGDLPATAPDLLSTGQPNDLASKAVFQDHDGNIWAFFTSNRTGNQNIFLRRFPVGTQVWGPEEAITTDPASDSEPVGLVDSTGDIWIFWNSNRGATSQNLWMKRFRSGTAAWDVDTSLTSSAGDNFQQIVLEDKNTNLWVFWMSMRSGNKPSLWLKRYLRATNTWTPDTAAPLISSPAPAIDQLPSASTDAGGTVYMVWQSNRNASTDHIFWNRLDSNGNLLGSDQQVVPASTNRERDPFLLVDSRNQVWAFWRASIGSVYQIQAARFDRNAGTWTPEPNLTTGTFNNFSPIAVVDGLGNVWAIWRSVRSGGQEVLVYRIFNQATASWSIERPVTPAPGDHKLSAAISTAAGGIMILWTSAAGGTSQAIYRQIFPAI